MRAAVRVRVLALVPMVLLSSAVETTDPALLAAQRALAAGQPVAAVQALDGHAARGLPGEVCLLRARALLLLGRPGDALDGLGVVDGDDLARWPERLRGSVAALMGEGVLADGRIAPARPWLEQALRLRGPGVEIDRVLVLLAESCERLGDARTAERAAHLVWRDWPRSPYRARAGVIGARLRVASRPDEARELLAGVRALDRVDPSTRLAAAELLCHLLLAGKPGQCLVVAEQESARLAEDGRLPLYRALALGALDPAEGVAALDALPAVLREDPAAAAARSRWPSAAAAAQDVALRFEHARAQIDLGHGRQARALLEPLAATHAAALVLLARIPEVDPAPWLTSPAMADPTARAAVAIALARRGDHAQAWALFSDLLSGDAPPGITAASLWFWAARSAAQVAPERVPGLTARLLAIDGEGVESGIAWAEEAQRRERSGHSAADVAQAWERAGQALPPSHPWQPAAILRASRHLVQGDAQWDSARQLLERVSGAGTGEDHLRCRFLLVQVYEHLGMIAPALALVRDLLPAASAEQAEKLVRIRLRLEARAASEVHPGPLDAEN